MSHETTGGLPETKGSISETRGLAPETPEGLTFESACKRIEALRTEILFERADDDNLPPQTEQYLLLAIGALEQAQRFMKLAHYLSMRGE